MSPDALKSASNVMLCMPGIGILKFLAPIDVRNLDLDNYVIIEEDRIEINHPNLDVPIEFMSESEQEIRILKNGEVCEDCEFVSYEPVIRIAGSKIWYCCVHSGCDVCARPMCPQCFPKQ